MDGWRDRFRAFRAVGHLPTLLTSLLYFDFCFAIWVLNGAMAPYISAEFGLSPGEKGFWVSVPVRAGALMRFPLGVVSQYIGRKRAAQVEMGTIVLALSGGFLFVETYTGVLMMGIALGVAGASFGVALSLGSGWYPPKYKGLAMGIAGAGNSGAVIAMLFAPPLAKAFGWRAVYGMAVFPMLMAMVLLQVFAKEPPDREHKSLKDYLKVLVDRDAWIFNLMYMVTFGGYIGLTSFLPTLFHDQYGIPKEDVGNYSAIIVVAASVLRVLGGWMADHVGGLRLLRSLAIVIVVLTATAALMPGSPWVMVAILVTLFAAMGAGNGAVFQLVRSGSAPRRRSRGASSARWARSPAASSRTPWASGASTPGASRRGSWPARASRWRSRRPLDRGEAVDPDGWARAGRPSTTSTTTSTKVAGGPAPVGTAVPGVE
jgi:NNP family nitrate/nitrite transporter-like MFS transporter